MRRKREGRKGEILEEGQGGKDIKGETEVDGKRNEE